MDYKTTDWDDGSWFPNTPLPTYPTYPAFEWPTYPLETEQQCYCGQCQDAAIKCLMGSELGCSRSVLGTAVNPENGAIVPYTGIRDLLWICVDVSEATIGISALDSRDLTWMALGDFTPESFYMALATGSYHITKRARHPKDLNESERYSEFQLGMREVLPYANFPSKVWELVHDRQFVLVANTVDDVKCAQHMFRDIAGAVPVYNFSLAALFKHFGPFTSRTGPTTVSAAIDRSLVRARDGTYSPGDSAHAVLREFLLLAARVPLYRDEQSRGHGQQVNWTPQDPEGNPVVDNNDDFQPWGVLRPLEQVRWVLQKIATCDIKTYRRSLGHAGFLRKIVESRVEKLFRCTNYLAVTTDQEDKEIFARIAVESYFDDWTNPKAIAHMRMIAPCDFYDESSSVEVEFALQSGEDTTEDTAEDTAEDTGEDTEEDPVPNSRPSSPTQLIQPVNHQDGNEDGRDTSSRSTSPEQSSSSENDTTILTPESSDHPSESSNLPSESDSGSRYILTPESSELSDADWYVYE